MSQSTMIDSSRPVKQKRSLNFYNKKKEAERIDMENANMMKRLQTTHVSPHIDHNNIRKQMQEIDKYKKTIQGTCHRHLDITPIIEKTRLKKAQINSKRSDDAPHRAKRLPPLPENYFGNRIDEVSSARDSIIENESQYNVERKKQTAE